jgi:hypothetical protein
MERPEEAGLFVTENCQYDVRLKRRGNREGRSEREGRIAAAYGFVPVSVRTSEDFTQPIRPF